MYAENNIFAKIIRSEIPCDKVYEDEDVIFFKDINPVASVHVLAVPKIQCVDFIDFMKKAEEGKINNFYKKIFKVIEDLGLKDQGYRLISNSGKNGGQEVPHYHVHIIGGEKLGSKIY